MSLTLATFLTRGLHGCAGQPPSAAIFSTYLAHYRSSIFGLVLVALERCRDPLSLPLADIASISFGQN